MKTTFEWAGGYPAPSGLSAKIAGMELERLRQNNEGKLTADVVLQASKARNAPLHRCFEWDDTKAAETYRRGQARDLIGAVLVIELPEKGQQSSPVRAFVRVKQGGHSHYTTTAVAMSDVELRAQVLASALGELQSWRTRYDRLKELSKIYDAIDAVSNGIEKSGQQRLAA